MNILEKIIDEVEKEGTTFTDEHGKTTIAISGPKLIFAAVKACHEKKTSGFKHLRIQKPVFEENIKSSTETAIDGYCMSSSRLKVQKYRIKN